MELANRMVERDNRLTERLLESARGLSDAQLNEPVLLNPPRATFAEPAPSIRTMLDGLVLAKETWVMAVTGRGRLLSGDVTVDGMLRRSEETGAEFARVVREIEHRGGWDNAFVDTTATPPRSNTLWVAVAGLLAQDAAHREIVAGALLSHRADRHPPEPVTWEHEWLGAIRESGRHGLRRRPPALSQRG